MVAEAGESHILDFPQMYQRPDAHLLLEVLSRLTREPRSWKTNYSADSSHVEGARFKIHGDSKQVTQYLTAIVGSQLKWIQDDDMKEKIWAAASSRLTERAGRTAMSAIDRSFEIPTKNDAESVVSVNIHEPTLTADNLGLKTWAASFMLAQRFARINIPKTLGTNCSVLEIGAGTGLVGIAAAIVFGAPVILTDLPDIVPNLQKNVDKNQSLMARHGGSATTGILDWSKPNDLQLTGTRPYMESDLALSRFPIIVAADSIYSADQPALFVQTIQRWLSPSLDARLILEMPRRESYIVELQSLKDRLALAGLAILEETEEIGHDDWGNDTSDDDSLVNCWYSMWSWKGLGGSQA